MTLSENDKKTVEVLAGFLSVNEPKELGRELNDVLIELMQYKIGDPDFQGEENSKYALNGLLYLSKVLLNPDGFEGYKGDKKLIEWLL